MSLFIVWTSFLFMLLQPAISASLNPITIPPREGETVGTCPSQEKIDAVIQNITASIQIMLQNKYSNTAVYHPNSNCGEGEWYQVASLNMSDPSNECPVAWREYNTNGVRACGRPVTNSGSCPATFYSTGHQYSRVCGRAIGYQYGSTDSFVREQTLDSYYVYGVSITHGTPRNHIWTLASGLTSSSAIGWAGHNCPCSDPEANRHLQSLTFVGDNYYCESAVTSGSMVTDNFLYNNDPLWDGQQCEAQCCSNGKSPPWFSVTLPNPTTDDIEVRICCPEGTGNDIPVQLLELYIQ